MKKKVVLNAGGTGGHFFPSLAVADELVKRGFEIYLITDKRCEKYVRPGSLYKIKIIDLRIAQGLMGKLLGTVKILFSTLKALIFLKKLRPDLVISFGGYPTIPTLSAAVLLNIPLIIHEQNAILGRTNKFFATFATIIASSYAENKLKYSLNQNLVITGDIVRESIKHLAAKDNFNNPIFRIFVFGGSQSARVFSKLIPEAVREVLKFDHNIRLKVTQQVSLDEQDTVRAIYKELGILFELSDFFHDIAIEYSASELVICRSGASTIAELAAAGVPAIFIPFPYATDNHQFFNAKALENEGASWCLSQAEVTSKSLARKILELANNRKMLKKAADNLQKRKGNGAKILADTVEKIIQ